jgi:hypothetical protein
MTRPLGAAPVSKAYAAVSEAARHFESRWTLRSLWRIDPALHERLRRQIAKWDQALVTGTDEELEEQTAAMCRGWRAVARRMEEADIPDDAYLMGVCPKTGLRVAIGDQLAAMDRVRELHGDEVVWLTPAEVATMLAGAQALASVKALFPGAEIIDLYPTEPTSESEAPKIGEPTQHEGLAGGARQRGDGWPRAPAPAAPIEQFDHTLEDIGR